MELNREAIKIDHKDCLRVIPYGQNDSIPLCKGLLCACILLPGEKECPGCNKLRTPNKE